MSGSDFDWDEIKATADRLISKLAPFELLHEDDYRRFRLSVLTYRLISSTFREKVDYGEAVYPLSKDTTRRYALASLAYELGWKSDLSDVVPEYLNPKPEGRIDHVAVVLHGIDRREVSQQFLVSWGKLHELFATYNYLILGEERFDSDLKQALGGTIPESMLVQKHWYAHWIKANAKSLKPADRGEAENTLQDLCLNVYRGRKKPWAPYPVKWFLVMITEPQQRKGGDLKSRTGKNDLSLSWRFRRISVQELQKMLKDPILTPEVLPPLSPEEFEDA